MNFGTHFAIFLGIQMEIKLTISIVHLFVLELLKNTIENNISIYFKQFSIIIK